MTTGNLLLLALCGSALTMLAQNTAPAGSPPASPSHLNGASENAEPGIRSSYVIGPTDVLSITVMKEGTLSGSMLVRPDGMISMPLLGDLPASGMTPKQLADDIAGRLKKYVQDPNVSVVLVQINSKKIYLIGEVGKVGPVPMTPDMTLLEAISSAGGLSQYAKAKKIYILRTEHKNQVRIPVRYKEALKGDSGSNLVLQPGDTIVVP